MKGESRFAQPLARQELRERRCGPIYDRHTVLDFGHRDAAGPTTVLRRQRHRNPFSWSAISIQWGRSGESQSFGLSSCRKPSGKRTVHVGQRTGGSLVSSLGRRHGRRSGRGCAASARRSGARTSTTALLGVVASLADHDVRDAEFAAVGGDCVEHLRQK